VHRCWSYCPLHDRLALTGGQRTGLRTSVTSCTRGGQNGLRRCHSANLQHYPCPNRAACWTCVPSRAFPVGTASTSAAVSSRAIARDRADCSSHFSTAVGVVSHFRPIVRPGRSPRRRRLATVSAETVSNCAVRWPSKTSAPRGGEGRDGGGRASSRLGIGWQAREDHSRKGPRLLEQNPNFAQKPEYSQSFDGWHGPSQAP
jgi:hypothetical protein